MKRTMIGQSILILSLYNVTNILNEMWLNLQVPCYTNSGFTSTNSSPLYTLI